MRPRTPSLRISCFTTCAVVLLMARAQSVEPEPPRVQSVPQGSATSPIPQSDPAPATAGEPEAVPLARLKGRVVDQMGKPVEGAFVHLFRQRSNWGVPVAAFEFRRTTRTDEDGRFEVESRDLWVRIQVRAQGWSSVRSEIFAGVRDLELPDLVLVPDERVSGLVRSETGGPLPWAHLRFVPRAGAAQPSLDDDSREARADADGRFEVTLDHIDYHVYANALGHAETEVDRPAGQESLSIALPLCMGWIRGTVVDASGRGVPQVTVHAECRRSNGLPHSVDAVSGEDGTFHLVRLLDETYEVRAIGFGLASAAAIRTRPGTTVRLDVRPYGSIAGRVLDGAGEPLGLFAVRVSVITRGVRRFLRNADRGDARGTFRIDRLPPGRYILETRDFEGGFVTSEPIDVDLGSKIEDLEIRVAH